MRVLSGKRAWLECVVVLRVIGFVLAAMAGACVLYFVASMAVWLSQRTNAAASAWSSTGQVRSVSDALGVIWLFAAECLARVTSAGWSRAASVLSDLLKGLVLASAAALLLSRPALSLARRLTLRERTAHG